MPESRTGLKRFTDEYRRLAAMLEPADFAALLGLTLLHAPEVLRTRRLTSVDQAMGRELAVHVRGRTIQIPAGQIDRMLAKQTPSFCFGVLREMYARDVYLRAFRPMRCPFVLDLGSNRGLFSLLARVVLDAERVIEVEPRRLYTPVAGLLSRVNGLEPKRSVKVERLMTDQATEQGNPEIFVLLETLIGQFALPRIDFAKIDIEGAEAALFRNVHWLAFTQNIALELHPETTPVQPLIDAVRAGGLALRLTDDFGRTCDPEDATYLYASRTGALL